MLRAIGSKVNLLDSENTDYHSLVADLIDNDVVQQMKEYIQHGDTSCFQHCVNVSYYNYRLCKLLSLNARAGARAGLLHDLFLYDWHNYKRPQGERLHGFTHAKAALNNVNKHFYITAIESDIIEKHMFPLTLSLPKHKETVVIILVDKYCGLLETVGFRVQIAGNLMGKVKNLFGKEIQSDVE